MKEAEPVMAMFIKRDDTDKEKQSRGMRRKKADRLERTNSDQLQMRNVCGWTSDDLDTNLIGRTKIG